MNSQRTTPVQLSLILVVFLALSSLGKDALAQIDLKRQAPDQAEQTVQDTERKQFLSRMTELVETGSVRWTPEERAAWKIRREARQASVAASQERKPRLGQAVVDETVAAQGPTPPPTIFTVNSAWDDPDAIPGNGFCATVYYLDPGGTIPECTLRAAIQEANATAGTDSVIIRIDVVSSARGAQYGFQGHNTTLDVWRIVVNGALPTPQGILPAITRDNVHIDGTYQLDGSGDGSFDDAYCGNPWAGDTNIVKVMIDGTALPDNVPVLSITGDNVSVRGIAVANGDSVGINADGANNLNLDCIHVGTDHFAKVAEPNGDHGIVFRNGENLHLAHSIVSGSAGNGLSLAGNNSVLSTSFFGTDRTGMYAIGNGLAGFVDVVSAGASATNILASGNTTGVVLSGDEFTLSASKIGVNTGVSAAIPNVVGVYVNGNLNTIGGSGGGSHSYISGNTSHGVELTNTAFDNVVANVAIGTDLAGTSAIPNGGVGVLDGGTNTIGKAPDASSPAWTDLSGAYERSGILSKSGEVLVIGTLISGNTSHGIQSTGSTTIANSFVGTNNAGSAALPNGGYGIYLQGTGPHTVGGTTSGAGNLVSGNGTFGIVAANPSGGGLIAGNIVGLDATGTFAISNGTSGLYVTGPNYVIGGTTAAARNVISGNLQNGIQTHASAVPLEISGNYIGTNAAGTTAVPNGYVGITNFANNALIGGPTAAHRNVISGNGYAGIESSTPVTVQNNYIGTDATGTAALGNGTTGVLVRSSGSTIGGSASTGNVISGNGLHGILIEVADGEIDRREQVVQKVAVVFHNVSGNKIGTDISGLNPLGNAGAGIWNAAAYTVVVGNGFANMNTIAYNGEDGIRATGNGWTKVDPNRIFANGDLAMDLANDGVTPNDIGPPHDTDSGPNGLQNFPQIVSVQNVGEDSTHLVFDFFSAPSTNYRFNLVLNSTPDPSGHGEAETWAASFSGSTDVNGHYGYDDILPSPLPTGQWLSMLATNDATYESSEFSGAVKIAGPSIDLVNAKVFLEGPYAAGSMATTLLSGTYLPANQPYGGSLFNGTLAEYDEIVTVASFPPNTVDWVTLSLRTTTAPGDEVARRVAFVDEDGYLTDLDSTSTVKFAGLANGNYYLGVCHRNHLCAMSSAAVDFTTGSGTWDFTTGQGQAYSSGGDGLKHLGGGVYGLFAGDNSADGEVTVVDFNQWNAETTAGLTGYIRSDHDLNGNSTAGDFNLWNANTTAGAASQVPN